MAGQQNNLKPKLDIPIDTPISEFEQFLNIDDNKRIFFSGKYGIGKTCFLQEFFKTREKQHDVYHLFPVKYQITSDEDIMELLRYDILVELVKKDSDFLKINKNPTATNFWQKINYFLWQSDNQQSLLHATSVIPKLNQPLAITMTIIKLIEDWQNMNAESKKSEIQKMYTQMQKQMGETHMLDAILSEAIKNVKNQKEGVKKNSVLILDDFERIDPEHIFRILNILSPPLGNEEDNKFGFDYVIIVGDIKNIKSIFCHRYGDVDFDGYFDKFFTVKPYEFNNQQAVNEKIPELIQSIPKFGEHELKDNLHYMSIILQAPLAMLLATNNLSLRQFYRWIRYSPALMNDSDYLKIFKQSKWEIHDINFQAGATRLQYFSLSLQLLLTMFNSKEQLKRIIEKNQAPPKYLFDERFSRVVIEILCESGIQIHSPAMQKIAIYKSQEFRQERDYVRLHQRASESLIILIDASEWIHNR